MAIDRFRQSSILSRLEQTEGHLKSLKKEMANYHRTDKEMVEFAKKEIARLKSEIEALSNEYEMVMAEHFSEDEIIDHLRDGWHLAHDGLGGWSIFSPDGDIFGERITPPSTSLRNKLVEFGHRVANCASYRLK